MRLKMLWSSAAAAGAVALVPFVLPSGVVSGADVKPTPEWSANATAIEACSCPMFCQCYFNTKPAAHSAMGHEGHGASAAGHFCRANIAYKINKGHYGAASLDGARFWIAGDLGDDWSKGNMDWAVLTFDKALTQAQRDGIVAFASTVFPAKWRSFTTAEGVIDTWQIGNDSAVAMLDGGKTAEVRLKRFAGMTDQPVVIKNLRYWGAPRNDGFVLFPNEVEAYRAGPNAFEYKGTNGFLITVDVNSRDVAAAGGK